MKSFQQSSVEQTKEDYPNKIISFNTFNKNANIFFFKKIKEGYKGFYISRNHSDKNGNYEILNLNKDTNDLNDIEENIISKTEQGTHIIYIDRLEYLVTIHGFNRLMAFLYAINDNIKDSIILIHINKKFLTETQIHAINEEFAPLLHPDVENDIRIENHLFEILNLINSSTKKVSFKQVCKAFEITKTTARKRIYELQTRKYIDIKKDGRSKILELTEIGKSIL